MISSDQHTRTCVSASSAHTAHTRHTYFASRCPPTFPSRPYGLYESFTQDLGPQYTHKDAHYGAAPGVTVIGAVYGAHESLLASAAVVHVDDCTPVRARRGNLILDAIDGGMRSGRPQR